jgi:hypothetical protein
VPHQIAEMKEAGDRLDSVPARLGFGTALSATLSMVHQTSGFAAQLNECHRDAASRKRGSEIGLRARRMRFQLCVIKMPLEPSEATWNAPVPRLAVWKLRLAA